MGRFTITMVLCGVLTLNISAAFAQLERQPDGSWPATNSKRDTEELKNAVAHLQGVPSGQRFVRHQDLFFDPEQQKEGLPAFVWVT